MAQRAESLDFEQEPQGPLPVVQFPRDRQPPAGEDHLARLRRVAGESYRVMQARAARSYSVMVEKSKDLATTVKTQFQTTRNEHPLRIVAAVAGTAFVLGIVLRVWRNHE